LKCPVNEGSICSRSGGLELAQKFKYQVLKFHFENFKKLLKVQAHVKKNKARLVTFKKMLSKDYTL